MEPTTNNPIKGGEFIIRKTLPSAIFIPEEWNEEQKMIAQMCDDFIAQEIEPNLERIDKMEEGFMQSLLDKAGELGMLGMSIPEELGGMGVDFKTSLLATERLGKGYSFSVAYGAHTGIGTLPLLYYGTEEQKAKYIPKLASGEWKAAYCLTEPGSGSDANSGKTKKKMLRVTPSRESHAKKRASGYLRVSLIALFELSVCLDTALNSSFSVSHPTCAHTSSSCVIEMSCCE